MGLRFRRSIRLMPGVRLNFGLSGVSATLGPRGASVNVGSRGAFLNLGLPGTGLSSRTRLTGNSDEPGPIFTSIRAEQRWLRHREKEVLRELAEEAHADREHLLDDLQNILRNRNREPLDWSKEFASRGPFQSVPFQVPPQTFTRQSIAQNVKRANSFSGWFALLGAAVIAFIVAPQAWIKLVSGLAMSFAVHQIVMLRRERPLEVTRLYEVTKRDFTQRVAAARLEHETSQAQRAARHHEEETLRERLRMAVERSDSDIVAHLLEVELSNEEFPIEVDSDVAVDELGTAAVAVILPGIDVVPPTRTQVTKTGKLSERRMAKGHRVSLYKTVCSGLILRLTHETFRVLPFVTQVTLTAKIVNDSPLHDAPEYRDVLTLSVTRDKFSRIDLDYEPAVCLYHLDADLRCSKDGRLG
jgi:hypothetical protein